MAAKVGGRLELANQSAERAVSASSYATMVWFLKRQILEFQKPVQWRVKMPGLW